MIAAIGLSILAIAGIALGFGILVGIVRFFLGPTNEKGN